MMGPFDHAAEALRYLLGYFLAFISANLTLLSHRLLHVAAWLLDHSEVFVDCPTCQELKEL